MRCSCTAGASSVPINTNSSYASWSGMQFAAVNPHFCMVVMDRHGASISRPLLFVLFADDKWTSADRAYIQSPTAMVYTTTRAVGVFLHPMRILTNLGSQV